MGTRITKFRKDKYDVQGQNFQEVPKAKASNDAMASKDIVERTVCRVQDLKDNEMKEFSMGEDSKILLVKENGQFSALSTKCSHYGAPLVNGVLCNGYVRCPWHGACFDSKTGDIEDFPGLDSLQKFEVKIVNDEVKVRANESALTQSKRQKLMTKRDKKDDNVFLIVGAGGAGSNCAETLRQAGFGGRIVMITKESHLPYDRPKLSKALDCKPETIALRKSDFYTSNDIEMLCNKEVTSIDTPSKTVTFTDESTMSYNKLLVATGGIPRRLTNIPGHELQNIMVLRSVDDANSIAGNIKDKNVVVLGMSFIGMEGAAYLVGKAASVTVIGPTKYPFLPVLGEELGERLKQLFEEKGVNFRCNDSIVEYLGKDGKLTEVQLQSGTKLPADLCLLGVGVQPSTNILKNSGIEMSPEGFVLVDENLKSNVDDVYAAGDIVKFPLFLTEGERANVQHWQIAHYHGHIAGLNMVNKKAKVHTVPFFWTMFFGISLRYTGYGVGYDSVLVKGNLDNLEFLAYYLKGERVIALATMKRDPAAAQFAEFLRKGKTLTKAEVEANFEWQKTLFD